MVVVALLLSRISRRHDADEIPKKKHNSRDTGACKSVNNSEKFLTFPDIYRTRASGHVRYTRIYAYAVRFGMRFT